MDAKGNGQSASLTVRAEPETCTRAEEVQSRDRASNGDPESGQTPGKQPRQPTENTTGNGRAQDKISCAHPVGPRILSLHEAAVYLGCCERTVRDLILDGVIPQVELTSRIQVDIRDLDKLIESKKKTCEYQN